MALTFGAYRRHAAWVIAGAALAVAIDALFYVTRWAPWLLSPEGEVRPHQNSWLLPVIISILLSAAAGWGWWRARLRLRGRARQASAYLGGLFYFMAVDDFLAIHEKLERFTGVDWLFIYAPVMALAAVAGGYLVLRSRNVPGARAFRVMALLGAAGWFFSQVLEAIGQFWDDAYLYAMELIVPEEALESLGSAFIGLAAFAVLALLERYGSDVADALDSRPEHPTHA